MTNQDTTELDTFEREIVEMLHRRATDVDLFDSPGMPLAVVHPLYAEATSAPPKRRHRAIAVAAALFMVVGAAGIVAIQGGNGTTSVADAPTGAVGEEVSLVVIEAAPLHVTEPALVLRVDGRVTVEVGAYVPPEQEDETAAPDGADTSGWRCMSATADTTGATLDVCGDLESESLLGWTPGGGGVPMVSWANVPPEAAIVTLSHSGRQEWQRPVEGLVFFPVLTDPLPDGSSVVQTSVLRALDANGAVIAEVSMG